MLIIEIFTAVLAFTGGVLVGAHNVTTVDAAIKTVDTAEANAAAVLSKIGAHKTTTTAPPTA